jgi:hypothetical protein
MSHLFRKRGWLPIFPGTNITAPGTFCPKELAVRLGIQTGPGTAYPARMLIDQACSYWWRKKQIVVTPNLTNTFNVASFFNWTYTNKITTPQTFPWNCDADAPDPPIEQRANVFPYGGLNGLALVITQGAGLSGTGTITTGPNWNPDDNPTPPPPGPFDSSMSALLFSLAGASNPSSTNQFAVVLDDEGYCYPGLRVDFTSASMFVAGFGGSISSLRAGSAPPSPYTVTLDGIEIPMYAPGYSSSGGGSQTGAIALVSSE